jgi:hypothetical protein
MAGTLTDHLSDDALGDVKEPGQVYRRYRPVVVDGVVGERLADENAGVVDQAVNPAEPL